MRKIDHLHWREATFDRTELEARVRESLADPDGVEILRLLGRLEEAERLGWHLLEEAGGPAHELDLGAPLQAQQVEPALRLAVIHHQRGLPATSAALYGMVLEGIESAGPSEMLAEAHEGLGRLMLDDADWGFAVDQFTKALAIRRELGHEDESAADERALREASNRARSGA